MNRFIKLFLWASIIPAVVLHSCRKETFPPAVGKPVLSEISIDKAKVKSRIIWKGEADIREAGFCWNTTGKPSLADQHAEAHLSEMEFECTLNNLDDGTTYYIRAYARNREGISYGMVVSFTTVAIKVPGASLNGVSDITHNSVTIRGVINYDNSNENIERGLCWTIESRDPTINDSKIVDDIKGTGYFSYVISGLSPSTAYYIRAYGINEAGVGYSSTRAIRTYDGTTIDSEGKVYYTTRIGNQEWMETNLNTTKFNNGDLIPTTDPVTLDIRGFTDPLFQWLYDRSVGSIEDYGRLYTWHVATDTRGICPVGWHVPTISDWTDLMNFYGGENIVSDFFISGYNYSWDSHWLYGGGFPGFNESRAGYRSDEGYFNQRHSSGRHWSTTEYSSRESYAIVIGTWGEQVNISTFNKNFGLTIRCLKNK